MQTFLFADFCQLFVTFPGAVNKLRGVYAGRLLAPAADFRHLHKAYFALRAKKWSYNSVPPPNSGYFWCALVPLVSFSINPNNFEEKSIKSNKSKTISKNHPKYLKTSKKMYIFQKSSKISESRGCYPERYGRKSFCLILDFLD